jgi:hypothetical protein
LDSAAAVQPHISPETELLSNASKNTDWAKILKVSALFWVMFMGLL